jgi:hypothetical protein
MPRLTRSGKRTAVADVEGKLKKEYGSDSGAIYGTLNKIGLMKGSKTTAKGRRAPTSLADPCPGLADWCHPTPTPPGHRWPGPRKHAFQERDIGRGASRWSEVWAELSVLLLSNLYRLNYRGIQADTAPPTGVLR